MNDPLPPTDPEFRGFPETPDTLTAETGFLRELSRGLLFDPTAADDVAQMALLAALRQPPRRGFSWRSWLAGIVKNLARAQGRAEQRRRHHEQAAARPEAVPSAVDTVARLELLGRVVSAVQQLDEPYRTAVLLRFFDGLSPRVIARRLDVPVETVRTRLKRALGKLREELDERHGRDRAAWGTLLLPTALSSGKGLVAGALAGISVHSILVHGAGALAMSTKAKVLAGAVVAAAATLVLIEVNRPPRDAAHDVSTAVRDSGPAAPIAVVPGTGEKGVDSGATATRSEVDPSPASASVDPNHSFVIHATTRLPDERPLGRVHVELRLFDGYETDGKPARSERLESDAGGALVWALPLPAGTVTLLARPDEPGYVGLEQRLLVLRGDLPRAFDIGFSPLDATVVGRVTDEQGTALPDAGVFSWFFAQPAACDELGEFEMAVPSNQGQWISAAAPGYAEATLFAELEAGGDRVRVDFRLRPERTIRGRITDEGGAPIAGARVRTTRAHFNAATSDAQGRYAMHGLDPILPAQDLLVECTGYASANAFLQFAGREIEQDFVLTRGTRVEGVVQDEHAAPLPGAEVWLGPSRFTFGNQTGFSHDDGSFVFEHVAPGTTRIGAEKEGLPGVAQAISVPSESSSSGIVLRIGAGHFLAGTVTDKEGRPVADATVTLSRDGGSYDVYTRSVETGRFRIDNLSADARYVMVYGPGFVMKNLVGVALDRDDVVFVLEHAGKLAGRVVDALTNLPLEHFRVRFLPAQLAEGEWPGSGFEVSWSDPGRTFRGTHGLWTSGNEALPIGSIFAIEASAEGYASTVAPRVVCTEMADPAALVMKLSHGARITGQVLGGNGEPLDGARVILATAAVPLNPYDPEKRDPHWIVHTIANGTFELSRVPAGTCTLVVSHPEWTSRVDGPFEVPASGEVARVVELERGGRIEGVLFDANGRPAGGQVVALFPPSNEGPLARAIEVTTDAAGRFAFAPLASGTWQVSSQLRRGPQSMNEFTARVTLTAPETATLELGPRGHGELRGRVTSDQTLPPEMTVSLQWVGAADGSAIATTPTSPTTKQVVRLADRGGFVEADHFELHGLDPGPYRVTISGYDPAGLAWLTGTADVMIDESEPANVTVKIERH